MAAVSNSNFQTIQINLGEYIAAFDPMACCLLTDRPFDAMMKAHVEPNERNKQKGRNYALAILEDSNYFYFVDAVEYAKYYQKCKKLEHPVTKQLAQRIHFVIFFTSCTTFKKLASASYMCPYVTDYITACSLEETEEVYAARKRTILACHENGNLIEKYYWASINLRMRPQSVANSLLFAFCILEDPFAKEAAIEVASNLCSQVHKSGVFERAKSWAEFGKLRQKVAQQQQQALKKAEEEMKRKAAAPQKALIELVRSSLVGNVLNLFLATPHVSEDISELCKCFDDNLKIDK